MLPKDKMKYYKQVTATINRSNTAEPVPFNANCRLVSTGIDHSSLAKKTSRLNQEVYIEDYVIFNKYIY